MVLEFRHMVNPQNTAAILELIRYYVKHNNDAITVLTKALVYK